MAFLAILASLIVGFWVLKMDTDKASFEHKTEACILCLIVGGLLYAVITGL